MIYAIRAVGTQFVKFGRAASVGKRLKELETGCPHELNIEAVADWPNGQESAIHMYLADHCEKYEWFRDSDRTAEVICWMLNGERGLMAFRVAFMDIAKGMATRSMPKWLRTEYSPPSRRRPRLAAKTEIAPTIDSEGYAAGANGRFEQIKQSTLERNARKAARAP